MPTEIVNSALEYGLSGTIIAILLYINWLQRKDLQEARKLFREQIEKKDIATQQASSQFSQSLDKNTDVLSKLYDKIMFNLKNNS